MRRERSSRRGVARGGRMWSSRSCASCDLLAQSASARDARARRQNITAREHPHFATLRRLLPDSAPQPRRSPVRRALTRIAILCTSLVPTLASAQPARFDFYDRGPYRAEVPRPAQVLGYEPGTFHTSYGNMERYVDALLRSAPD